MAGAVGRPVAVRLAVTTERTRGAGAVLRLAVAAYLALSASSYVFAIASVGPDGLAATGSGIASPGPEPGEY